MCAVCSFETDSAILLIDDLYIFLFFLVSFLCRKRKKNSCDSFVLTFSRPASVLKNTQNIHDTKCSLSVTITFFFFLFYFTSVRQAPSLGYL